MFVLACLSAYTLADVRPQEPRGSCGQVDYYEGHYEGYYEDYYEQDYPRVWSVSSSGRAVRTKARVLALVLALRRGG